MKGPWTLEGLQEPVASVLILLVLGMTLASSSFSTNGRGASSVGLISGSEVDVEGTGATGGLDTVGGGEGGITGLLVAATFSGMNVRSGVEVCAGEVNVGGAFGASSRFSDSSGCGLLRSV
jgi:hypothetical protein